MLGLVDSDAYFVAPSPTLYVMGAALTDLFTLVLVQAVVLKPNIVVAKHIINSFISTIRVTLFSLRGRADKRSVIKASIPALCLVT